MIHLLELHRLKPNKFHRSKPSSLILTATDVASTSSDDDDDSDLSKRNGLLPVLVATRPNKHRNKHHRTRHLQQLLMNAQQGAEIDRILVNQRVEQAPVRYVPLPTSSTSLATILERRSPVYPHPRRDRHLPRHAERLVNRFIHSLEDAHRDPVSSSVLSFVSINCRLVMQSYFDERDSDYRMDECHACRQLRSAMYHTRRRSSSDGDLFRRDRNPVRQNI